MINILFISSSLEKNGTEEFMMNVLRGLIENPIMQIS